MGTLLAVALRFALPAPFAGVVDVNERLNLGFFHIREIDLYMRAVTSLITVNYGEGCDVLNAFELELCKILTLLHWFQEKMTMVVGSTTLQNCSTAPHLAIRHKDRKRLPLDPFSSNLHLSSETV
jgi:hypothetical protein